MCFLVRPYISLLAILVVVLNIIDAVMTILYVRAGLASEANPLMAAALNHSALAFLVLKLSLVVLCVSFLWRLRHQRFAVWGLAFTSAAYSALLVYHLTALPSLLAI